MKSYTITLSTGLSTDDIKATGLPQAWSIAKRRYGRNGVLSVAENKPTNPTPAPWQHSEMSFDTGEYPLKRVVSIAEGGRVVAHINAAFGDGESIAGRIVRAVNAHDELVEALRLASEFLEANYHTEDMPDILGPVRAALAKAQS